MLRFFASTFEQSRKYKLRSRLHMPGGISCRHKVVAMQCKQNNDRKSVRGTKTYPIQRGCEAQQTSKGVYKAVLFYVKKDRDHAQCFVLIVNPNVSTG